MRTQSLFFFQGEQLHEAAIRFADRHNVNQCVGIIDGTYVPIRRPVRNEHCYINRKQYQSLNVLVSNIFNLKKKSNLRY